MKDDRKAFITPDKEWRWQEFEQSLILASTYSELLAVKARTPFELRTQVMTEWLKDGRYEWLKAKADRLRDTPEEDVMFWSSRADETLPQVGDLVRIAGSDQHDRPYEVLKRSKDDGGQVWLIVKDVEAGHQMPPQRVEPFQFWPKVGDQVLIAIGPYLDWLAKQRDVQAKSGNRGALAQIEKRLKVYGADKGHLGGNVTRLLNPVPLLKIKGDMGVVKIEDEVIMAPMRSLLVAPAKPN